MDFSSQETWRFINTFAPWLSAAGTVAAVITSLYFSRKDRRINLEVFADCRSIVSFGQNSHFITNFQRAEQVVVLVYIANVGHRDAVVDSIFWKYGMFSKRRAVQSVMANEWSSTLPKRIKDGEVAHFAFPEDDDYNWVVNNGVTFVGIFPWIESFFIKVLVRTSIGKEFEARIGSELRKMIVEAARKRG